MHSSVFADLVGDWDSVLGVHLPRLSEKCLMCIETLSGRLLVTDLEYITITALKCHGV